MSSLLTRIRYRSKCEELVAKLAQVEAVLFALDEANLCLRPTEIELLKSDLSAIRNSVDTMALPSDLISAAEAIGDAAHLCLVALERAIPDSIIRQDLESLKDIGRQEAPAKATSVVRIAPSDYESAVNYTARALESIRFLATLYKVDITPALVEGGLYLT